MHSWGNRDVDWQGISDAAEFIGLTLRKWGRVNVTDMKEKYGTVRVYCIFGWYQMFNITHPGYCYSRYPDWLWHLDCVYLSKVMPLLSRVVVPVQRLLYRYVYKKATVKWPHLKREILSAADYPELLKGL